MHSTRSKVTLPHINDILMDQNNQKTIRPMKQNPSTDITSNSPEDLTTTNPIIITKDSQNMTSLSEHDFFEKIQFMLCESEKRITLNVAQAIETRISTLENDVDQLKGVAATFNVESDAINMRLSSMEKLINEIRLEVNKKNNEFDTLNNASSQNYIDRPNSIVTNVVISGVPTKSEENLNQIVAKLFTIIGVKTCVPFNAFRLLKSSSNNTSSNSDKIPKILVKLNSIETKKSILQLKRNKNIFSTELNVEGEPSKIFISEQLTTETGLLFKKARELRKFGIKYVWTSNGNVLLKSDSKSKTVRITEDNDVIKIKSSLDLCTE